MIMKKCSKCESYGNFDKMTPINIINSLDNPQPLWVNENLSKSNKI